MSLSVCVSACDRSAHILCYTTYLTIFNINSFHYVVCICIFVSLQQITNIMISDLFFDSITNQVREICNPLGYDCSFNRREELFYVYDRPCRNGRPIITRSLVDFLSSVNGVSFVCFSIDDHDRPYALFTIDEDSDGDLV